MKKKKLGIALVLALILLALALSQGARRDGGVRLVVTGGEPVVYRCGNGDCLAARYYGLSDGSLNFVKVLFPDGREYTLPQVLSASGARYTDDAELIWWVKGERVYVEKRDESGEWRPLYEECRLES